MERQRRRTPFGTTDPGQGVIDEVVGMLITFYAIPLGWIALLAGFVLFRIFDIIKPYPAARFEYLPGGLGMMADDAVAALYAHVCLRAGLWMMGRSSIRPCVLISLPSAANC